uniref:Uncharacterized protein n=1 Tax=Ascaris lumbricoides TaxID=6252 RepID=A0A0M3HR48_ASCLU
MHRCNELNCQLDVHTFLTSRQQAITVSSLFHCFNGTKRKAQNFEMKTLKKFNVYTIPGAILASLANASGLSILPNRQHYRNSGHKYTRGKTRQRKAQEEGAANAFVMSPYPSFLDGSTSMMPYSRTERVDTSLVPLNK